MDPTPIMSSQPSSRTRLVGVVVFLLIYGAVYGLIVFGLATVVRALWGSRAGILFGVVYGGLVLASAILKAYRIILKGESPFWRSSGRWKLPKQ